MLLGLVLNYARPGAEPDRGQDHPPSRAAGPRRGRAQLPLAVQAGQTLTVVLEEATTAPELASGATTNVLRYTWTQPATYASLADLEHDLTAPTLKDGSANPFRHLLSVQQRPEQGSGRQRAVPSRRPRPQGWEARLSIPKEQPATAGCRARVRARRPVAPGDWRLPQYQRLVAVARRDGAGGRRVAGAGVSVAHAGPHLRQHLHRLRQQAESRHGARWTTWKSR